jgi:ribosome-associated protein
MRDFEDHYENDEDVEYYAVRPNKTRIKQDIALLFKLAENLAALPPAKLETFDLPEKLREDIKQAGNLPHTGARKRLLKYIAGQFHRMDVTSIQEQLASLQNQSVHSAREHHLTEKWRERLINEGDQALSDLIAEMSEADTQKIRHLLRNIKKETDRNQPPKSSRLLYRYLKSLFQTEIAEENKSTPTQVDPE